MNIENQEPLQILNLFLLFGLELYYFYGTKKRKKPLKKKINTHIISNNTQRYGSYERYENNL